MLRVPSHFHTLCTQAVGGNIGQSEKGLDEDATKQHDASERAAAQAVSQGREIASLKQKIASMETQNARLLSEKDNVVELLLIYEVRAWCVPKNTPRRITTK